MEEITDYKTLKNSDFKNEKDLKDYILENKEVFCQEVLGVKYKEHVEEFRFPPIDYLNDNIVIVDIVFTDTEGYSHLIELKCPKYGYTELTQGIGQCMSYYYLARVYGLKLADVYLVTSKHCNIIPLIIRDNNLMIKYIYFDKSRHASPQV